MATTLAQCTAIQYTHSIADTHTRRQGRVHAALPFISCQTRHKESVAMWIANTINCCIHFFMLRWSRVSHIILIRWVRSMATTFISFISEEYLPKQNERVNGLIQFEYFYFQIGQCLFEFFLTLKNRIDSIRFVFLCVWSLMFDFDLKRSISFYFLIKLIFFIYQKKNVCSSVTPMTNINIHMEGFVIPTLIFILNFFFFI